MARDENPYTPPGAEPVVRATKSRNLLGLILSVVVFVAAPFVGAMVTFLALSRAFQDTAEVEPSEKARVLAEGISAAMNGAAGGLVVSLAALVSAIVFGVRLIRARRANQPGPDVQA